MKKKLKAFTLIETLMVILVVAIMSAVAIPFYSSFQEKSAEVANRKIEKDINDHIRKAKLLIRKKCAGSPYRNIPTDSLLANDLTFGETPLCLSTELSLEERRIYPKELKNRKNQVNKLKSVFTINETMNNSQLARGKCVIDNLGLDYGWCYDLKNETLFASTSHDYILIEETSSSEESLSP